MCKPDSYLLERGLVKQTRVSDTKKLVKSIGFFIARFITFHRVISVGKFKFSTVSYPAGKLINRRPRGWLDIYDLILSDMTGDRVRCISTRYIIVV